ncbi:MAG: polysaccharide deacetylase family protein [Bacteroidota bacterium]
MRYSFQSGLPLIYPGAQCRIRDAGAVALTFDDGPSDSTDQLLDVLDANAIKATFFLSGQAVEENTNGARAIYERGHTLGSHGYSHSDLARSTSDIVNADLQRSLAVIESATGVRPKFYRPPYGRLNPVHRDLPASQGCSFVLWTSLPGDFDLKVSLDELRRRISKIHGGDIVVLHDHAHAVDRTTACVTFFSDMLRRKELRSLTLS